MRHGARRVSQLMVLLFAATACSTAVAGSAEPENVIGVTQRAIGMALDVTPLVFVDPAPVYSTDAYYRPEEGTRLVAVQFKVTNTAHEDELIGPVGSVHFHTSDGKTLDDSIIDTGAGVMFEQLRLAPKQSMVGYFTAEIADGVTVDAVDFTAGYDDDNVVRWDVVDAVDKAPDPPARTGDAPEAHPLGKEATVTGDADGKDYSLLVTATKVTDPVESTSPDVRPGPGRRLLAVEFAVRNNGDNPYDDEDSDADLRIFAVQNKADEAIQSHIYGASAEHGLPLAAGAADTWTIVFEVPTDFEVDRISFSPSFGDRVATLWTAS